MNRWKRIVGPGAAICAMIVLVACGGSSATGTNSGSTATTPGMKAASDYLAQYVDNPNSIGITTALSAKPPTGKSVIYLKTPPAVSQRSDAAQAAAAKVLGWQYGSVDAGATPASAISAFEAAISRHPDAIIFAGYPAVVFTKQIQEAKAAGIAVISDATGDKAVDGVLADLGGAAQEALYGRLVAAYFVVNSGGKGKAGIFNISAFPILTLFSDNFKAAVKEWCPDCTTDDQDQQLTDLGTKTPSNVVTYFQRNPQSKWGVFGNGDLAQGVAPALKTAGLSGINIIGEVPTQANLADLKTGTEQAWAGYPVDILSWRMMDLLARHFLGDDLAGPAGIPLPLQLITSKNVSQTVQDNGYYIAVDGYQQQFNKLWLKS